MKPRNGFALIERMGTPLPVKHEQVDDIFSVKKLYRLDEEMLKAFFIALGGLAL